MEYDVWAPQSPQSRSTRCAQWLRALPARVSVAFCVAITRQGFNALVGFALFAWTAVSLFLVWSATPRSLWPLVTSAAGYALWLVVASAMR
jgi:hypothetical protein